MPYAPYMADMLGIDRRIAKDNQYYKNLQMGNIPSEIFDNAPIRFKMLCGKFKDHNGEDSIFNKERYNFLLFAPFNLSSACCKVMKKSPVHSYARQTGRKPITAQMASESRLRTQNWLQNGCNGFDMKAPISNPMAFWLEQDVLAYIYLNNIEIASVYGDIVRDYEAEGQVENQMSIADYGIFDDERPMLKTTGCQRTGCMFCGYGCHLEKSPNRFEMMKETHPKLYEYIMAPGVMKYRVFDSNGDEIVLKHCTYEQIVLWVENNRENYRFRIEQKYVPDKGLGYKEVIDWINENGDMNIKY